MQLFAFLGQSLGKAFEGLGVVMMEALVGGKQTPMRAMQVNWLSLSSDCTTCSNTSYTHTCHLGQQYQHSDERQTP